MTRRFLEFSPVFASWHSRPADGTFLFGPRGWSSDLRYILAHDEAL
jgi:hypothetical protein